MTTMLLQRLSNRWRVSERRRVYASLVMNRNGVIDFNEWRLLRLEHRSTIARVRDGLVDTDDIDSWLAADDSHEGVGGGSVGGLLGYTPPSPGVAHARVPLVLSATPRSASPSPLPGAGDAEDDIDSPEGTDLPGGGRSTALVLRQKPLHTGVPSEYLSMIIERSASRELRDVVGESGDAEMGGEIASAALAFRAIDHDGNGMLNLDEFEQLLVGTTMASAASDDQLSRSKMAKM